MMVQSGLKWPNLKVMSCLHMSMSSEHTQPPFNHKNKAGTSESIHLKDRDGEKEREREACI